MDSLLKVYCRFPKVMSDAWCFHGNFLWFFNVREGLRLPAEIFRWLVVDIPWCFLFLFVWGAFGILASGQRYVVWLAFRGVKSFWRKKKTGSCFKGRDVPWDYELRVLVFFVLLVTKILSYCSDAEHRRVRRVSFRYKLTWTPKMLSSPLISRNKITINNQQFPASISACKPFQTPQDSVTPYTAIIFVLIQHLQKRLECVGLHLRKTRLRRPHRRRQARRRSGRGGGAADGGGGQRAISTKGFGEDLKSLSRLSLWHPKASEWQAGPVFSVLELMVFRSFFGVDFFWIVDLTIFDFILIFIFSLKSAFSDEVIC